MIQMATFQRSSALGRGRTKFVAGAAALAVTLAGCSLQPASETASAETSADTVLISDASCERNREVGPITYVSGYGYSASAGQLDVFIAQEMGLFDALCLDVNINAGGANGQQLVASGQAQFTALGSASDVMLAAANSRNLTAVATYGTTSPFSIFANEKVKSLKDLEGGTLGYFINITPIAEAMLDEADVDVSKVDLIKMTNYDPTVVTRGQVDAIVGYASNQPEKLRALELPFNEFKPADYGLQGTYNVMEVNTLFLEEHRSVVADFMRATLKALDYCLANEAECVDIISAMAEENNQGSAFPRDQQARTWAVESSWVRASDNPPGVQSEADWAGEYELVKAYGGVDALPPLGDMMDADLVASLYQDGELQWPGE